MHINIERSSPALWAESLTQAAARRSVLQRGHLANPDCPSCGGKGWVIQRLEIKMIGGASAEACKCTMEAR